MKRYLLVILCLLALCVALNHVWVFALAEDCFVIDVDILDMASLRSNDYVAAHLSAQTSGIRVQKYISDSDELAARVRLTILQADTNTVIFDKNYGYQSKTFDSGDIYLPFVESRTAPYLVTLYIEDWVYAMPFMHLAPRLSHNGACTFGVRMRDYDAALTSNWLMGAMLDLNDLRANGQIALPICASNAFVVGEANVSLLGDNLTVTLRFFQEANVELHQSAIYCIAQVSELTSAEPPFMPQRAYQAGESIDVAGQQSVLLYIPMSISYDSAGLSGFAYDLWGDGELQWQLALWNENLRQAFADIPTALPPMVVEPQASQAPAADAPEDVAEPLPMDISEIEKEPTEASPMGFPDPLWDELPEELP